MFTDYSSSLCQVVGVSYTHIMTHIHTHTQHKNQSVKARTARARARDTPKAAAFLPVAPTQRSDELCTRRLSPTSIFAHDPCTSSAV